MASSQQIVGTALSPAKINLGLHILGRRPDGYHEIDTVLQAITLFDRVTLRWPGSGEVTTNDSSIQPADNLIARAAGELARRCGRPLDVDFALDKRIPVAAGLGGGSSNAGTALRLLSRRWGIDETDPRVVDAAIATGSDVPFFLHGGRARATGRGERLEQLPGLEPRWVVLVVPTIAIAQKTARLYAALTPRDFSPSSATGDPLHNAFARALYDNFPEASIAGDALRSLSDVPVVVSGAGPGHVALMDDLHRAIALVFDANADERLGTCCVYLARTMNVAAPVRLRQNG